MGKLTPVQKLWDSIALVIFVTGLVIGAIILSDIDSAVKIQANDPSVYNAEENRKEARDRVGSLIIVLPAVLSLTIVTSVHRPPRRA